jgi:myosin heavy subunit
MSNLTNGNRSAPNKLTNGNSNIPLRKNSINRVNSNSFTQSPPPSPSRIPINNPEVLKWKQKYEEAEQKRKTILTEKEKIGRQYNDVQRKHLDLQVKNEQLETELFEKNENYSKLSEVSKSLYKEYEMLKNKYDTETTAMSSALKDASNWYKENKELKRKTMLLMDRDTVDEGVDAGESGGDSDIENLNKTIKQLSAEVAELQTEVDTLKHIEFTTSEQNVKLSEDLDVEKEKNKKLDREFVELKKEYEQIIRVSEMMKKELTHLKEMEENQRNSVVILKKEADGYKKERNVLAHQSTLLLQGLNNENQEEFLLLLQDVEQLKRSLEDERNKHEEEISLLQEKLEMAEKNSHLEVVEERLKLAESELQAALERAEKAEEALERAEKAEDALTRPPVPPPPPPPCLVNSEPPVVPLRVKRRSRVNIAELADAIGVKDKEPVADNKKAPAGVNEDIINVIKSGKFTLKKVKNENKTEREGSKAVSELLNILGSLRKAPKSRQSQVGGDVLL